MHYNQSSPREEEAGSVCLELLLPNSSPVFLLWPPFQVGVLRPPFRGVLLGGNSTPLSALYSFSDWTIFCLNSLSSK